MQPPSIYVRVFPGFCCQRVAKTRKHHAEAVYGSNLGSAQASRAKGAHYDVWDSSFPGFGVRVSETGRKTFVLTARYPGSTNPTRRALGAYGKLTLEDAQAKAQGWIKLLEKGIDPAIEEERQRAAEQQKRGTTFAAVAEDFIKEKLSTERKGKEVERDIRRDLIPGLGATAIVDITDAQIAGIIRAKKTDAPAQARNLLGIVKRFFVWAKEQRVYGLASNPAADLRARTLIGRKRRRERILADDELFALWRATARMAYPVGPAYRVLILAALRLNEAADAGRAEFDWKNRLWVIPPERMKGRDGEARAHAVPLTKDLLALFDSLPKFSKGDFLFSNSFGENPAWIGDKIKKRIDARMQLTLRALARRCGDDPKKVFLAPWVNHDIRRTVRSHLSRLKVSEEAREAVLAHARPGIKGTYDLHDYLDEKREALELWAARLRSIVDPPPSNVVQLAARA